MPLPPPDSRRWLLTLAAALVAMVAVGPALAEPEIWLSHEGKGGNWKKDKITFQLECSSTYAVLHHVDNFDFDNAPGGYPASTHILVEARNVEGNAGDQEMLPADHPGRAWGSTMWCQLWNDCTVEPRMELDINLTQTSENPVTLSDHNSSASGEEIMVTRGANTRLAQKVVSINRLCTSDNDDPGSVTITGTEVARRNLN